MKRIVLSFAVFALLIVNYAYAATYTYTGDNYTMATGVYTADMRVTGTLVTSSPIPPSSETDISGILTSWSFSDGVQTITSADGELNPNYPPLVATDEHGVITASILVVFSSPLANTIGDTDDYIGVAFGSSIGVVDIVCATVTDGFCETWTEPESNYAQSNSDGVWAVSDLPSTSIPTMTQWSLILMVLLLGLVGIARIRRKV